MNSIKKLSSELSNERWAVGYLKTVDDPVKGKYPYQCFVIRFIKESFYGLRVFDHAFTAGIKVMNELELIKVNNLVCVGYEFGSGKIKEFKDDKGYIKKYVTNSAKAKSIFVYGKEAPGWVWKVVDGMDKKDVSKLKKEFPKPPDLTVLFPEPSEFSQRRKENIGTKREVMDYVDPKAVFNPPEVVTVNDVDPGEETPF